MMTSRPPKRGGGLLTISGLILWFGGPDGPEIGPLRGIHPAGEVPDDHSRGSAEAISFLEGWGRLELRRPWVTCMSKAPALLDGSRVRPGIRNVSSDERRRALVSVEACLCCSEGPKRAKLFECCILMSVCMLHDEN